MRISVCLDVLCLIGVKGAYDFSHVLGKKFVVNTASRSVEPP